MSVFPLALIIASVPALLVVVGVVLCLSAERARCVAVMTVLLGLVGIGGAIYLAADIAAHPDPQSPIAALVAAVMVGVGSLGVWILFAIPAVIVDLARGVDQRKHNEATPAHPASSAPPPHG